MQLSNAFTIGRPPAEVFDAFLDVERIASCMPGSKLLGQSDENTYDGEVSVKVGPLSVAYSGTISMLEIDREQMSLTMRAKGREKRGAGNADAYVVAHLREQDGGTHVQIDTELHIRGKVAQFGRGAIADVTDGIMQTFAQNVEQLLSGAGAPQAATSPTPAGQPAGSPAGSPTERAPGPTTRPGSAVTYCTMQTLAQNAEQLPSAPGAPQAATSPTPAGQPAGSPAGSPTESAAGPSQGAVGPTGPAAETASSDLDAWSLIIR